MANKRLLMSATYQRRRQLEREMVTMLNRRGLMTQYETRRALGGSLIVLDVDGPKRVNDLLGHQAGDELIQAVGQRIAGQVAHSDVVARWGGDEFVILLGMGGEGATAVAHRVQREAAAEPIATASGMIPAAVSFGVAQFAPGVAFGDVLERADDRLYRAKGTTHTFALPEAVRAAAASRRL